MRKFALVAVIGFTSLALFAQAAKPAPAAKPKPAAPVVAAESTPHAAAEMPVKRVVLYKNGVGYFEHSGQVRGNQELNIRFTTAQLNDVLKSLTVVDLGGGRVTGVRYNSIAPLSQRLSTLRIPLGEDTDQKEVLSALRGARVEVHAAGGAFTGRLLSVETIKRKDPRSETEFEVTQVTVASDAGEVRSFEMGAGTGVRLLDPDLNQELGRYLSLVGSARAKDLRQMTISTTGTGEREVQVSYISEVPVWKSTYRIVLPRDASLKPLLQGWAIIDNTVGEDWKDVELSLVAGAPQSFIQNISQPIYMRRPTIALPTTAMLTPQTHEGTVEGFDKVELRAEVMAPAPPPSARPGAVGGARPMAKAAPRTRSMYESLDGSNQAVEVTSAAPVENAYESLENTTADASGAQMGDLFSYNLKQRITVLKNQSALVPIVHTKIDAEKVTIWSPGEKFPLRALWLNNTSGLTLDGGTFNIIESDQFAGEGIFEELKPAERRLLSYAADTAVRITTVDENRALPATRIVIAKGMMTVTREQRSKRIYTIHSADTSERSVVIEHPARPGWKLSGGVKPEETTASFHRFKVKVAPGATEKLTVEEFSPIVNSYELTNITDDMVKVIVAQQAASPALQETFRKLLAKKAEISAVDEQIANREREVQRITQEQSRLRENMKVLKGSAEEKALLQRYVTSLNQQEDRLAAINKENETLNAQRDKLTEELEQMALAVAVDEKTGTGN